MQAGSKKPSKNAQEVAHRDSTSPSDSSSASDAQETKSPDQSSSDGEEGADPEVEAEDDDEDNEDDDEEDGNDNETSQDSAPRRDAAAAATASNFDDWYLRETTREFADDLDKVRGASDFTEDSLPILIQTLRQCAGTFTDEQKRKVMTQGEGGPLGLGKQEHKQTQQESEPDS